MIFMIFAWYSYEQNIFDDCTPPSLHLTISIEEQDTTELVAEMQRLKLILIDHIEDIYFWVQSISQCRGNKPVETNYTKSELHGQFGHIYVVWNLLYQNISKLSIVSTWNQKLYQVKLVL